ncbi:MAG: glycerate kinase [Ignavibacteriales bacterium]|nr:glycerate kinase [Ignavibacteriales bacterium]
MKEKKILVVVDKFKGSLTSKEANQIIKTSLLKINSKLKIDTVSIADGGDGTVDSFIENLGGKYISVKVSDPLNRKINAQYGILKDNTAIIELASASGINLLKPEERNPLKTTSYGTGELIKDALRRKVKKIIIGLGGSATNDGGVGIASALGVKFFNSKRGLLTINTSLLNELEYIDLTSILKIFENVDITVLSDVTNPLLGKNGASYIYSKQKGAKDEQIPILEENLKNLARVVKKDLKKDFANIPGVGAAGGCGYGLSVFFDAKIVNGIDYLVENLNLEDKIKNTDYVITGEGKLDNQTLNNKVPWGILQIAKKYSKKTIAIAGIIEDNDEKTLEKNFDYCFQLVNSEVSVENSIKDSEKYLSGLCKKIAEIIL